MTGRRETLVASRGRPAQKDLREEQRGDEDSWIDGKRGRWGGLRKGFERAESKKTVVCPKVKGCLVCLFECVRVNVDILVKRCKTQDFFDQGCVKLPA